MRDGVCDRDNGLGGQKSRVMRQYLARTRAWLTVEQLPGYAPELNPVEQIWGNLKGCELANLCPVDILALRGPLRAGFARIRHIDAGLRLPAARGTVVLTCSLRYFTRLIR
jgi:DDE superfamily endonuclease